MNQPVSHMPPAARRQVAEANRMIAELNAKPGEQPAAPAAPAPQVSDAPPDLPEITFEPAKPVETPPPDAQVPAQVDPKIESKYKTLKGKYDAEVPRLRQQLEEQQAVINRLAAAAVTPQQPAREPPKPLTAEQRFSNLGVSSKEVEEYGPELLDLVARVAQGTITPELRQMMAEQAEIKKQLGAASQAVAQTSQEKVWAALDAALPNWREINSSDEFLAWLQEPDVFSGSPRIASLQGAFNSYDATRVVSIFRAYVGKTPVPTPSRTTPVVDRGTLVAPGQPRGGAMEAPEGNRGRILSEQEVGDFYTRVRKRQVTPEEYKRVSAEIALAVAEGRVKPTHNDFHANAR